MLVFPSVFICLASGYNCFPECIVIAYTDNKSSKPNRQENQMAATGNKVKAQVTPSPLWLQAPDA